MTDLADAAERNDNFRKVLWTGENLQLTLMCLRPGEDIGSETHCDTDQCLIIESGTGVVELGCGGNMSRCPVCAGSCVCIPAGTRHNLTNTGCTPLKLCSIYAPPEHERGAVQETKEANNCCRCRF